MTINIKQSHIHLDIVGGIAGDMFIAAMLDACPSLKSEALNAVTSVLPSSAGKPLLSEGINAGISGLRFTLQEPEVEHHHNHAHADNHTHDHSHHTTYKYLCKLLTQSSLPDEITQVAIDLLTIIAKAEAKIHAKTLNDVHFHELADWDSLMDVVASAVILHALKPCSWSISKLPIGGGLVNTQHGLIPVPAPATAEILTGFEFFDDGIQGERITPTGAAILRFLSDKKLISCRQQGHLHNTGYGLGSKIFPGMPNILRAMLFDLGQSQQKQQDTVVSIEFDIDDMTGEELAFSLDLIRQFDGVIDVTVQTARGKKNRAVELVRILASTTNYQNIIEYCFIQTSTIGLRYRFETRAHLSRTLHDVNDNAFKSVTRPNGIKTIKIEHEQLTTLQTLNERRMQKYKIESPE